MKFWSVLPALSAASIAAQLALAPAMADEKAGLVAEGQGVIKRFATGLEAELKAALQAKGAPHAISACNERAPQIAAEVSGASGWSVGRSSHKLRNPGNAPDDFTAAALKEFLSRIEKGEKPEALAKAAIVEVDGERLFRLVKAIPTGEVCLNCHGGAEVKQPVVDRLAELYPQDQARGFSVGDMRGVFTLSKRIEQAAGKGVNR